MDSALPVAKHSIQACNQFARQGKAQLQECVMAAGSSVDVTPVWNKSNREHNIIGSLTASARAAADEAVKALGWNKSYYVDADHANIETVEKFIAACGFFTIDVADVFG